jgi:hypothetical protein
VSYRRVIPRDLFNEANLLKCLGRISLLIEDGKAPEGMRLAYTNPTRGFEIDQSPGSGDLCCLNLMLVTKAGRAHIWRGLNSRDEWPIFVVNADEEEIEVFDDNGAFAKEFLMWAKGSNK